MAFCNKCGTQLPDGSTFCNKCGAQQGNNNISQPGMNAAGTDNVIQGNAAVKKKSLFRSGI